jgi:hypothetical protein
MVLAADDTPAAVPHAADDDVLPTDVALEATAGATQKCPAGRADSGAKARSPREGAADRAARGTDGRPNPGAPRRFRNLATLLGKLLTGRQVIGIRRRVLSRRSVNVNHRRIGTARVAALAGRQCEPGRHDHNKTPVHYSTTFLTYELSITRGKHAKEKQDFFLLASPVFSGS